MTKQAEQNEPPEPPEYDRGLELNWPQLIGIPLLALIPALAVAGVFGEHWESATAQGAALHARVDYPDRFRARLSKPITVSVENRSSAAYDTVEVVFDTAYMERFTGVNIMPSPGEAYVTSITDLKPGETKRVHVEMLADHVGRHRGQVAVRTRGDSAVVLLRTTVFP